MRNFAFIILLLLIACSTRQPLQGNPVDEMNAQLHQDLHHNQDLSGKSSSKVKTIAEALMPKISIPEARTTNGSRYFDIAVKDMPAPLFYTNLVKGSSTSIIVSPEIQGKINLNMKHVTIKQVLQALEDAYGYIYHGIPGGYEIVPNNIQTKIYSVNYLAVLRSGQSNMRLSSGEVTEVVGGTAASATPSSSGSTVVSPGAPGSTTVSSGIGRVQTISEFDFWKQMENTVRIMVGLKPMVTNQPGLANQGSSTGSSGSALGQAVAQTEKNIASSPGSSQSNQQGFGRPHIVNEERGVTVNPLAGVVVVRAYPKEQKQVEAYLDLVQNNMDRQIILEAKILEVTLKNQYQMGIDWRIFGARLNAISDFPGTDITLADFPDAFSIDITWNRSFTTTIRALEEQA